MNNKVSIIKLPSNYQDSDIIDGVRQAIKQANGLIEQIKPETKVLITPNLVAVPPEDIKGAITSPVVTRAVADYITELGATPIIGDSSAVGVNTEDVISVSGYDKLRKLGYEVRDLKTEPVVNIPVPFGKALKQLSVYRIVKEVDSIITVPVMKTHDQLEVSLGIKNLKGLIPDKTKKAFHNEYGLVHAVNDLLSSIKPIFSVIDATYALEGLGPVYGESVNMGMILAGKDLVSVDSVASEIMGLSKDELLIENEANKRGLGKLNNEDIQIAGNVKDISNIKRSFTRVKDFGDKLINDDFKLVFNENVCTGCKNTVLSCLDDIHTEGFSDYLKGTQIYAGPIPKGYDQDIVDSDVLIGSCLAKHEELGNYVPGCPPENLPVIEAMIGKGKIGMRYSDIQQTYQGIIFDLDNTLINSKIDFGKMKREVFNFFLDNQLISSDIELSYHTVSTLIEQANSTTDQQEERLWQIITSIEAEGMSKAELEPGAKQVLEELTKDYTLTVLTNNSTRAAKKALEKFQLADFFDLVVGRAEMEKLKPSPCGVIYVLEQYPELSYDKWVMIGDSWIDGKAAQSGGISFIGYRCNENDLTNKEVNYITNIESLEHLLNILFWRDYR
ncbi:HAD-IA family hydrolase [Natranaerobius trueperi]|uniref:DUF362 domain-containing protein n=1 Tax=Natranaerobius trueperi TaxID=759412 RepID=A0A226BVV9_9FIRM|nr:HAD-IA family hydrolase [Natranaerobius trueperi]OWZ82912.1 hypothetical protein CDO51_11570 [Natranaerobius trueperi]